MQSIGKRRFIAGALAAAGALALAIGHALAAGIDELPKSEQATYRMHDPAMPIGVSQLRHFVAKEGPPWKIGYASDYAGNNFRALILDEFVNVLAPRYKKAGLISNLVVTQSDQKDTVQIQQMRQMVDDGIDAIIILSPNVTALNSTIAYAHSKGVAVIAFSGFVTSQYAVNATENSTYDGYVAGNGLFSDIGGKGNVLLVSGIPGIASSDSFDLGVKTALKQFPKVKLIGDVAGEWTDQIAQVEVQKFLATNPEPVNGIVTVASTERGVINAVQQSGRPLMPMVIGDEASAACFWRKHPDFIKHGYHFWPPRAEADLAWNVTMRVLEGQGPKVQTILRPTMTYSFNDLKEALPADCDENSNGWLETKDDLWFPAATADAYFDKPHDPLTWKP